MQVGELIEKLEKMDYTKTVYIAIDEFESDINSVIDKPNWIILTNLLKE